MGNTADLWSELQLGWLETSGESLCVCAYVCARVGVCVRVCVNENDREKECYAEMNERNDIYVSKSR